MVRRGPFGPETQPEAEPYMNNSIPELYLAALRTMSLGTVSCSSLQRRVQRPDPLALRATLVCTRRVFEKAYSKLIEGTA